MLRKPNPLPGTICAAAALEVAMASAGYRIMTGGGGFNSGFCSACRRKRYSRKDEVPRLEGPGRDEVLYHERSELSYISPPGGASCERERRGGTCAAALFTFCRVDRPNNPSTLPLYHPARAVQ